jgi:hypothetical protein
MMQTVIYTTTVTDKFRFFLYILFRRVLLDVIVRN